MRPVDPHNSLQGQQWSFLLDGDAESQSGEGVPQQTVCPEPRGLDHDA